LKKLNITIYFETSKGIKNFNVEVANISKFKTSLIKNVSTDRLYIGFDGLKDEFTLVGTPIRSSPHFQLMKILEKGESIKNTDYYYRITRGILDERKPVYIESRIKDRVEKYVVRKNQILLGEIKPIIVYELNEKLYIVDGKHRAALAHMLRKKIDCVKINNEYVIANFSMTLYLKMCKNSKDYNKNISFMESIIKEIGEKK
jgi:hypothetical protein